MFRSVLVANRGEIALRVLKALKDLGIRSVAVHSEADRDSPHLEWADESVCIGGPRSGDSYLNMEAILQAAEQMDCQAVHPGFGFLAENARFAAMCGQVKVTFIGPAPGAIRLMGDKAAALRRLAESKGVPLEEIAFVGDDLNDRGAMRLAGVSIAPADAVNEIKQEADVVTECPGGRGAARETVEAILGARGAWEQSVADYLGGLSESDRVRRG